MAAYLIRRLWQMIPTLLGVVLLVFFLFKYFGGDPAEILGGLNGLAPSVQNYAVGFSVTFPLFDFAALQAREAAQSATIRAQAARLEQIAADLRARWPDRAQAVVLMTGGLLDERQRDTLPAAFAEAHRQRYGHTLDRPLDVIALRVADMIMIMQRRMSRGLYLCVTMMIVITAIAAATMVRR